MAAYFVCRDNERSRCHVLLILLLHLVPLLRTILVASAGGHRSPQEELDDARGAVAQRVADSLEESGLVFLARPLVLVHHRRVEEAVQVRLGRARRDIGGPSPERIAGLPEYRVAPGVHEEVYRWGPEDFAPEVEAGHPRDFLGAAGHSAGFSIGGQCVLLDGDGMD